MTTTKQTWFKRGLAMSLASALTLGLATPPVWAASPSTPEFETNATYQVDVQMRKPDEEGGWNSSFYSHLQRTATVTTDSDGNPTLELRFPEVVVWADDYETSETQWVTGVQVYEKDSTDPVALEFNEVSFTEGYYTIRGEATFVLPYWDSNEYTGTVTLNNETQSDMVLTVDWSTLEQVLPEAAVPEITPNGADFETSQEVTITCDTPGATILYTTDGSDPSYSSGYQTGEVYSEPFTVTRTTTVKAIAYVPGEYDPSAVASATFTRTTMPELVPGQEYAVTISVDDPQWELTSYVHTQAVVTADQNGSLTMKLTYLQDWQGNKVSALSMYQVEGSEDSQNLKNLEITPAAGTIGWKDISGTSTFQLPYAGVKQNYTGTYQLSDDTSGTYTLSVQWDTAHQQTASVATPVISPNEGSIYEETEVTITCDTPDATIYYTLDGTTPTQESTQYTGPFTINQTTTVKAIAVKDGMGSSFEATATYTWSLLGQFTGAEIQPKDGYTTLTLNTEDTRYGDAIWSDQMSSSQYFVRVTQGDREEKFVYNGGVGGFALKRVDDGVQMLLNFDSETWDLSQPITLDVVMEGSSTKHVVMDASNLDEVTLTQEDQSADATGGAQISSSEMKPGQTYTATFQAFRIDDGVTESMLAGFFDPYVEIKVAQDGTLTASFYNTVYAHSMLDFAIQSSDGTWKGAITDGSRVPETDASGKVVAAVYTLPISALDSGYMVGAVNVQAMGGTEAMNGMYDRYTQVKLVFDTTVTEGFEGFQIKNSGFTQAKLINRALMTVTGLDMDGDGYITTQELNDFRFAEGMKSLDLSSSTLMNAYGVFDPFKIQDISWLADLGDKSLESINFNGNSISEIHDEFLGFTQLTSLNLSANCISTIDDDAFSQLSSLKDMKLASNLLTVINDKLFDGLSQVGAGEDEYILDLENNRISSIAAGAFDDMEHVTGLYLARNQLVKLNANALPQRETFTWLSLTDNQLIQVPEGINQMSGITDLYLNQNDIAQLGSDLDGMLALETLNLSDNLLEEVPASLVETNPALSSLDLSKNSLRTLPTPLLAKVAEGGYGFASAFEYNSVDLSTCDLSGFTQEQIATIQKAAGEYPSKHHLGLTLEVGEGTLSYQSQLSAFDYYYWALCKGGYVSWEIEDKLQEVLGKTSIDTVEELLKFQAVDLPDFSQESIKGSILTDKTGTVDAFTVRTDVQELRNGTWYTLSTTQVSQDEDACSGTFQQEGITPEGRYRLVKTVTGTKAEHRIVVYSGTGTGETPDQDVLEDGIYSVKVDMYQTDRSKLSMSNNAINHTVKLEVVDGVYYVTLDFKGMAIDNRFGYLSTLSYYDEGYVYSQYGRPQGDLVLAEVLSTQKNADGSDVIDQYNDANHLYPDQVRIRLVSTAIADRDGFVPLHVFVPIMEAISAGTGDQDVLMKVDWSSLEKTTEDDPDFQPEEPVEQSPAVNYTDEKTGVTVCADKGVFPAGVGFEITPITSGSEYSSAAYALQEVGKKFKLYQVKFVDANGEQVVPNGTVSIGFPIPNGYADQQVAVYRMATDNKVLVRGSLRDDYYTVITKSAGAYALVEKGSTITDAENTAQVGDVPQTGDSAQLLPLVGVMMSCGLALAGCTVYAARKRKG